MVVWTRRRLADRCGVEVPPPGAHMVFQNGRVHVQGGAEPVTLGPGTSFRLENTRTNPCDLPDGEEMTMEDMIRQTVREMFKEWTETAKDGGYIVIGEEEAAQDAAGKDTAPAADSQQDAPGSVRELLLDVLEGKRPMPDGAGKTRPPARKERAAKEGAGHDAEKVLSWRLPPDKEDGGNAGRAGTGHGAGIGAGTGNAGRLLLHDVRQSESADSPGRDRQQP